MNLEKRAIDQLAALPQPITVKGGGYAYKANVKKNPYKWMASDGSPITLKNIKELGEYLAKYIQEDWDAFIDDQMDAQDLVDYGIIRVGEEGSYRDQEDFEHSELLGDSIGAPKQGVPSPQQIAQEIYDVHPDLDPQFNPTGEETFEPPGIVQFAISSLSKRGIDWRKYKGSFFEEVRNAYINLQSGITEDTDMDMTRLLKLAGMYHKPQVFETEENKEGDQSPLSDVTDFVADVRGEKPKDPEKFVNADGDKSVLSEKDVEEGWDPFQDELDDEDYYDDQSQEDFPGRSRRFANPGSALYAADSRNPRIHPCPTCGGENRLTQRDLDAGYQCDRCADAAEGIGLGSYGESIEETEVEEDYLEPPHQKDPHTNEEDDWYDPEDARRQMARMGANPEFTGRHELKPHDPVADQAREDEWIKYQNAEQEQMAAMDDWDVFNKQGVEEEGELGNGYGEHHVVDGEDFFPSAATSNVARKVGPSGARHGDNPLAKSMATESAKIFEKYQRDFEDFKKKD